MLGPQVEAQTEKAPSSSCALKQQSARGLRLEFPLCSVNGGREKNAKPAAPFLANELKDLCYRVVSASVANPFFFHLTPADLL